RAPDGKFASKEPNEPEGDDAGAEPAPTAEKPQGKVPQQALHAAREKERAERERAERLERELAELKGRVEGMSQPRQPEPEPEKKVEFWEAPDKFVESALTPLQQEIIADRLYYSQRAAVTEFGSDTVEAAKEALKAAVTN